MTTTFSPLSVVHCARCSVLPTVSQAGEREISATPTAQASERAQARRRVLIPSGPKPEKKGTRSPPLISLAISLSLPFFACLFDKGAESNGAVNSGPPAMLGCSRSVPGSLALWLRPLMKQGLLVSRDARIPLLRRDGALYGLGKSEW